ncbi:MAG: Asp-tRNA(Asn)/Glu-tRNA(Gln) amidotransferase subunit GatB [Candidatus Sumerlaeia bacterium]
MSTPIQDFEPVIGFEVHAELSTQTKVFCRCPVRFGAPPNTLVCPVCLGLPGSLPVLNRRAVEFVLRTAIALNCRINEHTYLERKNYYYPDLPKNYQISQNACNMGEDGWLEFEDDGRLKRARIHNVHLEEDAGKLIHPEDQRARYSLVDLNRAGTALMEIVTQPDLHSLSEAASFMTALRNLLLYIEVSDCRMEEGSLRFEANISVRPRGSDRLGTKVEIKNLNSMKTALKCIEYEIRRQSRLLADGGRVLQETRLWDEATGTTEAMRSKEFAPDYRYFPEPDLVELHVTPEWQDRIRAGLPELPQARKERFIRDFGLPEYDAAVLTASKKLANYFEAAVSAHNNPKALSNWIMSEMLRELNERNIEPDQFPAGPEQLAELIALIDQGVISGKIAKQVFAQMADSGRSPALIVKEQGLVQITDASEIETLCRKVISDNPDAVAKYRAGQEKVIGHLVGQVMKASRGKANPQLVNDILRKQLKTE